MGKRKIAFPGTNEGLEGTMTGHFGHTEVFTTISYNEETGEIEKVEILDNPPHNQGGCMQPVMLLKNNGVDEVIVLGIGHRPLMGFKQVGIDTFLGTEGTVKENFELFWAKKLQVLAQSSCSGGRF